MAIPKLDDLLREGVRGRRVLVRADLNVPLDGGRIRDDTRIRRSLPTLRRLLANGARVVVVSHLGRPGGRRDAPLSLQPVAPRLAELGTSCPDHFLRTKIKPLYLDWNPHQEDLPGLRQKIDEGLAALLRRVFGHRPGVAIIDIAAA